MKTNNKTKLANVHEVVTKVAKEISHAFEVYDNQKVAVQDLDYWYVELSDAMDKLKEVVEDDN